MAPREGMTRQELYELVWSKPMRDVAATIPMSDVGLRKACVRHNVPVPRQGYWNKIYAGRKLRQVPLPPGNEANAFVAFTGIPEKTSPELTVRRAKAKAALRVADGAAGPDRRTEQHSCCSTTAKALHNALPDRRGALKVSGPGIVPLNVAPESVDRAINLLADLALFAEKLGYGLSMASDPARLLIDGELVGLEIAEKYFRTDAPADAAELARRDAFTKRYPNQVGYLSFRDPWMFRPSGIFTVSLHGAWGSRLRTQWVDKGTRVEARVPDIIAEAVAHAAGIKARREKEEREEAAKKAAEKRRARDRAEREAEERREEFISERAALFEETKRIAAFAKYARAELRATRSPQAKRFLEWAAAHTQCLRESLNAEMLEQDVGKSDLW